MIVNGTPWYWQTIYCVNWHLSFYEYFGLMMACLGWRYSPVFKLINYEIVVFGEVNILFHFNVKLNTTGCPLLKKKRIRYHDNTSMTRGCRNPTWFLCWISSPVSCLQLLIQYLWSHKTCVSYMEDYSVIRKLRMCQTVVKRDSLMLNWVEVGFCITVGQILFFVRLCSCRYSDISYNLSWMVWQSFQ